MDLGRIRYDFDYNPSHQITIAKKTVVKQGLIMLYDDFHLSGLKGN